MVVDRVAHTGFFGKLPGFGDFVSRRVPDALRASLDGWLAAVVAAWRLSDPAYETRYDAFAPHGIALAAGIAGSAPAFGLLWSSRDSVGRRFPAVLIAAGQPGRDPLVGALEATAWYEAAQRAAEALGTSKFDPDSLDRVLEGLDAARSPGAAASAAATLALARARLQAGQPWTLPVSPGAGVRAALARVAASALGEISTGAVCLWPLADAGAFAMSRGWPPPADVVRWMEAAPAAARGRTPPEAPWPPAEPVRVPVPAPAPAPAIAPEAVPRLPQLFLCSRPGVVYLAATLLADEPIDGATLSEALAAKLQTRPQPRLALQACLPPPASIASGSAWLPTADGGTFSWFGAACIYRWRGDTLLRLSAPAPSAAHSSLAALVAAPSPGADERDLVRLEADIEDGDRFLLCADGAYDALSWAQLASALQEGLATHGAERLKAGWRAQDGRCPGSIVIAFDLTDVGLEATHAMVGSATVQAA